jgi:RNase P protein component
VDLVVIAKSGTAELCAADLLRDYQATLKRLGLSKQ